MGMGITAIIASGKDPYILHEARNSRSGPASKTQQNAEAYEPTD